MANKSVYQNFDTDALAYFGLEQDTIYGVLSGSGQVNKVLCTQDKTTYEKIETILTVATDDGTTFRTKKKAFILPKCTVSQDRLKAALKEHGITITNDYELADLIIGHDDISNYYQLENSENIPSSIMITKLWNYETTLGRTSATHPKEIAIHNSGLEVIITPKLTDSVRYYDLNIESSLYDQWMLTGMAVNLAHIIETTNVSVVDPETVLHSSANRMILDEQLLTDLKIQLSAGTEDSMLAYQIIPTIDYNVNYHLLWKFAQDCAFIVYGNNRNKDLQYWLQVSEFNDMCHRTAQDMILWLEAKKKLNSVNFKYLEPIVRQEICIENRDLYTFKVAVKKEYQQYLKKTK